MKKLPTFFVPFLLLITLIFVSCHSGLDQSSLSGEISFAFTTADLDRIAGRTATSDYSVQIYLSVDGETQMKTTSVSGNTVAPVTFTNIKIGAMVSALAVIYNSNGMPIAHGSSDQITIQAGENHLTIRFVREEGGNGGNGGNDQEEQEELPVVIYNDSTTPIVLWNGITAENELNVSDTNTYTHVISQAISGSSFTRGAKVFNTVNENTTINSAELPSNVYCFGDDCIYVVNKSGHTESNPDPLDPNTFIETYVLDSLFIEKYTSTASGYVKDTTFTDVNVMTAFTNDEMNNSTTLVDIQSIAWLEFGGQLYFFLGFQQTDNSHGESLTGCAALNPSSLRLYKTGRAQEESSSIPAIQVVSDGSSIDLYYAQNETGSPNVQYIKKVHFTAFGYEPSYPDYMINNTTRASASTVINLSSQTDLEIPDNTAISDIKLIGDTIYVSVYAQGAVTSDSDVYFETSTSTEQKALIVSNGGIIKVDLSGTPAITAWSNGDKVLGWYRKTYYVYDQSGILTEETNGTIQPPLSQKSQYFYGAKKILAKITESGQPVLFVADDGAYIDAVWDNGFVTSVSSRNMNRIVKVNLTTESISAYNVNVSFDASVISETYDSYGYSIFGVADLD